jgi:DnaJ-class molecular chaperone
MKQIIEETQDICTLCAGRGQEINTQLTAGTMTCRQCQGRGYLVTKRVIRTETNAQPRASKKSEFRQT